MTGLERSIRRARRLLIVSALCSVATAASPYLVALTLHTVSASSGRDLESAPAPPASPGLELAALLLTPPPTPTPSPTAVPTPTATPTPRPPFVWPADGWISQKIGPEHAGIDIAVAAGKPVRAVRDGRVAYAGGDPCCSYGYVVVVQHDDGWKSLYAHLSKFKTRAGESLTQGQLLGLAGATGKASGPHLHFELFSGGRRTDPLRYLPRR